MWHQKGSHTVEFSIAGAAFFLLLFGALEVGRLFYTLHGLTEGTRRGARVAAVCGPIDQAATTEKIQRIAAFGDPDDGSGRLIPTITPDKFVVTYLYENGNAVPNGKLLDDFELIRYVRVSVTNYNHQFIIPGFSNSIQLAAPSTTLPRESLGVPRDGVAAECPYP